MGTTAITRLQIQDTRVDYDNVSALAVPSLELSGNTIAIIGHNGAGKSTLIKTLLQLLIPASGTVSVAKMETDGSSRELQPSEDMAFCPESGAIFEEIKVESYIRMWCRLKTHSANSYRTTGSFFIESLSIAPLLGRLGRELSKGERRRVQTAIGFITEPHLFLFDEPFCGLDVQKTRELRHVLEHEATRTSYVISSHRMNLVQELADQVIVLNKGAVRAWGAPTEVAKSLCPQSYRLSSGGITHQWLEPLEDLFPTHSVSRHGREVHLSGETIKVEEIQGKVRALDDTITVQTVEPSLEESLNYYLGKS